MAFSASMVWGTEKKMLEATYLNGNMYRKVHFLNI